MWERIPFARGRFIVALWVFLKKRLETAVFSERTSATPFATLARPLPDEPSRLSVAAAVKIRGGLVNDRSAGIFKNDGFSANRNGQRMDVDEHKRECRWIDGKAH